MMCNKMLAAHKITLQKHKYADLRHLSNLSAAEASCKASTAASTAMSLCLDTSCRTYQPIYQTDSQGKCS